MAETAGISKVVVAYSGGLDTSVILSWIKETYKAEVIACCIDVGQGSELKGLEAKARKTGASKCYIIDAKKEFVTEYIFPAVKAEALYENVYYLGTALARPVIAQKIAEIVKKEKADAVCQARQAKATTRFVSNLHLKRLFPMLES